jgi:hypothetical protein
MATRSTAELDRCARIWEDDLDYPSAVFSGIVGDLAHRLQGGPHISIEDNPAGNYSIIRPDDKAPPGDWPRDRAAAVDMSMSKADMVRCYHRVRVVWADRSDPRRQYLNGWNVWDGSGDAVRLDFYTNTVQFATPDHKWHVHGEWRRRYVNSRRGMDAGLSMLRGQSKTDYLQGGTMAISDADAAKIAHAVWTRENPTLESAYGAMVRMMFNAVRPDRQQTPGSVVGFRQDLTAILDAVAGKDVAEQVRVTVREEFARLGPALAAQLGDIPADRVEAALRAVLGSLDNPEV